MRKKLYKDIFDIAIVASIYVVLTIVIQPLAYGELQFRLSEVLMLMVFFNKKYSTSMIIGCLIANLWSPYLIWDMMFGTLATAISCLFIVKSKHLIVASIWPAVFNGLIVGAEIAILSNLNYGLCVLSVAIGEVVVVTIVGTILFSILSKNKEIINLIKD